MKKILEMLNQVKLNVLLLDAIQQVPAYAKFLKDIYEEEKNKCAKESVLGNQHGRNSVWSYTDEIQRSWMSHNFMHHRTELVCI